MSFTTNRAYIVFLIQRHNLNIHAKILFFGRAPAIYLNNLLMFEVSYLYHYKHSFLSLDYIYGPQEVRVLEHILLKGPRSNKASKAAMVKTLWPLKGINVFN